MRRRVLATVMVGVALALVSHQGSVYSQQRGGGRGRFDPERVRQMIMDRMRERLGASEEEWTVIGPRLEKVMDLSRQADGGGAMRMFGGRRGGRPGGDEEPPDREMSPVEKAASDLQQAIDDSSASAAQIKQKLGDLRAAREKARQELTKAQAALREVLTVRQEAQLVLMGQLD